MRPGGVVVASPRLDHHLCLAQAVEDLARHKLVPELAVEALNVPVLPGRAALDIGGSGAHSADPALHGPGNELRTLIGPDVVGHATRDEELSEGLDHVGCLEPARHLMVRHSRVNSSTMLSILKRRPSWVRSSTKS